jgi:beta-lactamase regulating signal transducer with metallopeptidase domain
MKKLLVILIIVAFVAVSCAEQLCSAYTQQGAYEKPVKSLKNK